MHRDPFCARLSEAHLTRLTREVLAAGHLDDHAPAVVVCDLDALTDRLDALTAAFPPDTLHAIAIKAQPLVEILKVCVARGCGLEAASWEEVRLAQAAGCPPDRIVYDSPCKSRLDLKRALDAGIRINADNYEELDRIAALVAEGATPAGVGLRVNPVVGQGSIAMVSVAGPKSRFGVLPEPDLHRLLDAFRAHPWLDGLHAHVGSQGMPVDALVSGATALVSIAERIEDALGAGRLSTLDIGGGLSTTYREDAPSPGLTAWTHALAQAAPQLWNGRWRIVTELGRAVHAPCSFAVSRVEYRKPRNDQTFVTLHLGADFLLRVAYRPQDWHHDVLALSAEGEPLTTETESTTLVGPLCFSGDVLARQRTLPRLDEGDLVVLRDVGAYTMGMWSRHCSRGMPPVWGWSEAEGFTVLRAAESAEDLTRFWGATAGR